MFMRSEYSLFSLLLLWILFAAFVGCIDDACGACRIVANELIDRLESEGPKNHIDLRNRLDKSGKRHGKVIEYKISELRMIELLDDLCDTCNSYTWGYRVPSDGGALELGWISKSASQDISYDMSKEEARGRLNELNSYCGRLIEFYEDDLVKAIRNGLEKTSSISDMLCVQLAKACQRKSDPPKEDL